MTPEREMEIARLAREAETKRADAAEAFAKDLLRQINSPEVLDFVDGVVREAAHQRLKWGFDHDNAKGPEDWFWTVGRVLGKAMWLSDPTKRLHHLITAAAIMLNWHLYASGRVPGRERAQ